MWCVLSVPVQEIEAAIVSFFATLLPRLPYASAVADVVLQWGDPGAAPRVRLIELNPYVLLCMVR